MKLVVDSNRSNLFVALMAALIVTGAWFSLTWQYGFDLADEGFYWYGAQRVLRGEVPLRDFMSYDIGRYYWAAFFMHLMGDDGVFAARATAAIFQVFGIFLGVYISLLALCRGGVVRWIFALLVACILTVWVVPYYKVYDHVTSISIVGMLVLMLKFDKPMAWLIAGVCLGLAAMMGRNHGVYGALAAMLIIAMMFIKSLSHWAFVRLCGCFLLGILIGFSPTLIMMLAINGFSDAFVDSIVMMIHSGATNISLPVPWPWNEEFENIGFLWGLVRMSVGVAFIFLLAFPLLGILALAYRRFDMCTDSKKVFVAAIAASIPYAHYAFSRADLIHLSLGIFPALIGLLAASAAMRKLRPLVMALLLFVASVLTIGKLQPYLSAYAKNNLLQVDVSGQRLWVTPSVSLRLQLSSKALVGLNSGSGAFLALPDMPSLHAIYRKKMPLWEIYSLIPRDAEFEAREIKRLESSVPDLVLLSDHPLDRKSEFRYSRLHPLIYAWIVSRYQLSSGTDKLGDSDFKIYLLNHQD